MIRNAKGQMVLEYVLLLFVVVVISALMLKGLVNRDPSDKGSIMKLWDDMIQGIGRDMPD